MREYTSEWLLQELVARQSVNADMPGGTGEAAVAEFVAGFGHDVGLRVDTQEVLPNRSNARLVLPGRGDGRRAVLFDVHLDTVPPAAPEQLQPRVAQGRLYGRGACDTKASLAAALAMLSRLAAGPVRERPEADIVLLGTVDEEYLKRGAAAAVQRSFLAPGGNDTVEAAVVGEPTGLAVVVAHKGVVRFRLHTVGKAAHTSRPEIGVNAIYAMVDAIAALRSYSDAALAERTHPLLTPPTLTVSTIHGGVSVNIVPEHCRVEIDRRTLPTEVPEEVLTEIDRVLGKLASALPDVQVVREPPFLSERGLAVAADSPVVQSAREVSRVLLGRDTVCGAPFGTDGTLLSGLAGIPTIVLGPGDAAQAHSADEWVDLAEVEQAALFYERLALRLAARPG